MSAAPQLAADTAEDLLETLLEGGLGRGVPGVSTLYAYASSKLRGKLGDLSVFERAFGNELYAPLLAPQEISAGSPTVIGDSARSELLVRFAGETVVYQLGMVRNRHGDQAGRWSLSGLFREGVDL